jgi:CRP-like cAMP-binding protein
MEKDKEWPLLHKIYHAMQRIFLPKNSILFRGGDEIKHLRLVQDGVIEIYVYFSS